MEKFDNEVSNFTLRKPGEAQVGSINSLTEGVICRSAALAITSRTANSRELSFSGRATMPSIAAANPPVKTETKPVLDVPESFKAASTVVEKKCRNLEKRKVSNNLPHFN